MVVVVVAVSTVVFFTFFFSFFFALEISFDVDAQLIGIAIVKVENTFVNVCDQSTEVTIILWLID